MKKFSTQDIENFSTQDSQKSWLMSYYKLISEHDLWDQTVSDIINRMTIANTRAKSTQTSMKSTFLKFMYEFVEGNTQTLTPKHTPKTTPNPVFNMDTSKKEFKVNLLKISNEIRRLQTNGSADLDKSVSFYIREGKQLLKLYGFVSEQNLLESISARFNKKPTDVTRVKQIISEFIPNPKTDAPLELPKQGEFLKWVLDNGAEISENTNDLIAKKSLEHLDEIPKHDPKYVYLQNEREIITSLFMQNQNIWITGSAGLGKSTMLQQFCFEEGLPIIRVGCNYEADPNDMYFKQSFDGSKVIYYVQSVGKAFLIANKIGACVVILEELNSSNEATMIALHSATDEIKELDTEIGKIGLNKGVKCLVVGTGNIGYKGTSDLTPALQSRLLPYEKQIPTDEFVLENIWN